MTFADLVTGFPTHLGKVLSDPIKALQTLHNVIQVSLSVFMAVSVVQAALSHNYGIVCNEFDVKEKEITWVTWVFYMSKVSAMQRAVSSRRRRPDTAGCMPSIKYRTSVPVAASFFRPLVCPCPWT